MTQFNSRRLRFGAPAEADQGNDLPTPALVRSRARRALGIAEAASLLAHLPAPNESLHVVCTSRFDLSDVLNHLLERFGTADKVVIATLGYNRRNLLAMLRWLDAKAVRSLTLLASIFFRSHNGELWTETQTEFRSRGQRAACCHCHAKVSTLAFPSGVLGPVLLRALLRLASSCAGVVMGCFLSFPGMSATLVALVARPLFITLFGGVRVPLFALRQSPQATLFRLCDQ
jgi:hypothetical protein